MKKILKVVFAVDGSPHSQAAVRLITGMIRPAGTVAHVAAVVPERWSFENLSLEAQLVVDETLAKVFQVEMDAAEKLASQTAERLGACSLTAQAEVRQRQPVDDPQRLAWSNGIA